MRDEFIIRRYIISARIHVYTGMIASAIYYTLYYIIVEGKKLYASVLAPALHSRIAALRICVSAVICRIYSYL